MVIRVDQLTKKYGKNSAVDNISFSIAAGEICGFLGPNGAGKTTTMRILTGFLSPTSGSVNVAGFDVPANRLSAQRKIGYLPESTPLYQDMRVKEYLDFVASVKGLSGSGKTDSVTYSMNSTQITPRKNSLISSLSKGYKQRVGIAQALLGNPEVLILDEPTIGLDPQQISDVRGFIKELAGRHTIILSTHILPEAQAICSKVMIINKGKLIAVDSPEKLSEEFLHRGDLTFLISGPKDEIEKSLRQLELVESINTKSGEGNINSYTITPKDADKTNLRKSVTKLLAQHDWELIEMKSTSHSLEEVYLSLVNDENETNR